MYVMRFHVTIVAVEKQYLVSIIYSECVCNLTYPARKAHALYYIIICILPGSTMLFRIIS
jgi:hypothetical protein